MRDIFAHGRSGRQELEKLQDQIPPFPDEEAYALISAELGAPARTLFSELSASPIAAASLGQVGQLPASSLAVSLQLLHGVCVRIAIMDPAKLSPQD